MLTYFENAVDASCAQSRNLEATNIPTQTGATHLDRSRRLMQANARNIE